MNEIKEQLLRNYSTNTWNPDLMPGFLDDVLPKVLEGLDNITAKIIPMQGPIGIILDEPKEARTRKFKSTLVIPCTPEDLQVFSSEIMQEINSMLSEEQAEIFAPYMILVPTGSVADSIGSKMTFMTRYSLA